MSKLYLPCVSTVEHGLLSELGISHPTSHLVIRIELNIFSFEGLFVQLIWQFDYFELHLSFHDCFELLLHLWSVAVVGAELSEPFGAGELKLIELTTPVDIIHVDLVELIPVLEQVNVNAVVICHSEAVFVKLDRLSLHSEPIVVKLVELEGISAFCFELGERLGLSVDWLVVSVKE